MGRFRLILQSFSLLLPLLLLVVLSLGVEGIRLGCSGGIGCLNYDTAPSVNYEYGASKEAVMRGFYREGVVGTATATAVAEELRWVPSGPDPLHHNGSPKKPQTP
ncbi:uncharacterized protein LOC109723301 [Ananas comosus]|uniref:Uncharacterized protein LOC109723301 n=1 Tax=Ananas comosus TaxID=4615 RepID=A0A6P5GGY0_ANACO|nr:uncharacterized protein LOC109723301 [Ananas comosus]